MSYEVFISLLESMSLKVDKSLDTFFNASICAFHKSSVRDDLRFLFKQEIPFLNSFIVFSPPANKLTTTYMY